MTKAELVQEIIKIVHELDSLHEFSGVTSIEKFNNAIMNAGKLPTFMYSIYDFDNGGIDLDFDPEYNLRWKDWNLADLDVAKLKELVTVGKELLEKANVKTCRK